MIIKILLTDDYLQINDEKHLVGEFLYNESFNKKAVVLKYNGFSLLKNGEFHKDSVLVGKVQRKYRWHKPWYLLPDLRFTSKVNETEYYFDYYGQGLFSDHVKVYNSNNEFIVDLWAENTMSCLIEERRIENLLPLLFALKNFLNHQLD